MMREPIHPGRKLCADRDAVEMSAAELCRRIEVPVSRITEILNVRRAVTDGTALRPGRVFGTSGEFWLNLPKLYELRQAEERMGAATTRLPSPDDGCRTPRRGVDIRPSPLRQPPERSFVSAGFAGSDGCAVVVNDDKYGPACAGVGLNPRAFCLRKKSNRNRGNLHCTQIY